MYDSAYANAPDDIVQIKGKQNRAPNPEYLPYVQDFVKSGQWGEIGDLGNTGLTRLPDKRLITKEQFFDGMTRRAQDLAAAKGEPFDVERWANNQRNGTWDLDPDRWDQFKDYFEGYKRGGRVRAKMPVDLKVNTCGCEH